jgi:hypothetical protein
MSGGDPHPCRYTEPVPGTSAAEVRERLVQFALKGLQKAAKRGRCIEMTLLSLSEAVEAGVIIRGRQHEDGQNYEHWLASEVAALLPKPLEVRMAEELQRLWDLLDDYFVSPELINGPFAAAVRAALESGRWKDVQP